MHQIFSCFSNFVLLQKNPGLCVLLLWIWINMDQY